MTSLSGHRLLGFQREEIFNKTTAQLGEIRLELTLQRQLRKWLTICAATFLPLLSSCSHEEAFVATDYTRCRELGFRPESSDYRICLSEVRRRRVAAAPQPLRQ